MSKQKWLLATLVLWVLTLPYLSFWANSASNNIFEVYQLIENTLNLKAATITTEIPYPTIKEAFEKSCPAEAISGAKKDLRLLEVLLFELKKIINKSSVNNNIFSFQY